MLDYLDKKGLISRIYIYPIRYKSRKYFSVKAQVLEVK